MAEAKGEVAWTHTSAVLAAIWTANPNLAKPRTFEPDEFNPHAAARGRRRLRGTRMTADNIDHVVEAFLGRPPIWADREKKGPECPSA